MFTIILKNGKAIPCKSIKTPASTTAILDKYLAR
jgi:hypothetical protein